MASESEKLLAADCLLFVVGSDLGMVGGCGGSACPMVSCRIADPMVNPIFRLRKTEVLVSSDLGGCRDMFVGKLVPLSPCIGGFS
jgi:hypothetical protein